MTQEQIEPDGYVVLNEDEEHIYSSNFRGYCVDHINDACEYGIDGAGRWVIRGFVLEDRFNDLLTTMSELACLGGGNSDGNRIAQAAIARATGEQR